MEGGYRWVDGRRLCNPRPLSLCFRPGGTAGPQPGESPGIGGADPVGVLSFRETSQEEEKGPKAARLKDRVIGRGRRSPRERTLCEARGVCTTVFEEAPVGG